MNKLIDKKFVSKIKSEQEDKWSTETTLFTFHRYHYYVIIDIGYWILDIISFLLLLIENNYMYLPIIGRTPWATCLHASVDIGETDAIC